MKQNFVTITLVLLLSAVGRPAMAAAPADSQGAAGLPTAQGVTTGTRAKAMKQAKEGTIVKEQRSGEWTPGLSDAERATLFAIAHDTLEGCVSGQRGEFSFDKYTITEKMKKDTATFVTLKIQDMLRGCIGSLAPVEPMYKSVHNNAINAAIHDYRFRPVTAGELVKINVHISLLSPITDIKSLDEFKLGEHGIIMEKGPYRAVYLPEVALEQKWTKDETLESLSEKAGLPGDAWKQGARFKVFSSVVLSKE